MDKKYKCCMIYENRPGHPAADIMDNLLKNHKIGNDIFPNKYSDKNEKKRFAEIPDKIMNNSKKYAIFLSKKDHLDCKHGNAFPKDIKNAAFQTRENKSKRILYTILDGNKKDNIVRGVKDIFEEEDVPSERVMYIKDYDPKKMQKWIIKGSNIGNAKAITIITIFLSVLKLYIDYLLENQNDFILDLISLSYSLWNLVTKITTGITDLLGGPVSQTNSNIVTGVITAIPVLVIWAVLLKVEKKSEDPLLWLNLRRFFTLVLLTTVLIVHKSAALNEKISVPRGAQDSENENLIKLDAKRVAVRNLYKDAGRIKVPIGDLSKPRGRFWIKEDGEELYEFRFDGFPKEELEDCPPLQEGHCYTAGWDDCDITKSGEKEFRYQRGKPIEIEVESTSEIFRDCTKKQLRNMVEKYGIEFSERFKIYSESESELLEINVEDAEDEKRILSVDIGIVCFILKDNYKEETIQFGIGIESHEPVHHDIPSGHVAVIIEFND